MIVKVTLSKVGAKQYWTRMLNLLKKTDKFEVNEEHGKNTDGMSSGSNGYYVADFNLAGKNILTVLRLLDLISLLDIFEQKQIQICIEHQVNNQEYIIDVDDRTTLRSVIACYYKSLFFIDPRLYCWVPQKKCLQHPDEIDYQSLALHNPCKLLPAFKHPATIEIVEKLFVEMEIFHCPNFYKLPWRQAIQDYYAPVPIHEKETKRKNKFFDFGDYDGD